MRGSRCGVGSCASRAHARTGLQLSCPQQGKAEILHLASEQSRSNGIKTTWCTDTSFSSPVNRVSCVNEQLVVTGDDEGVVKVCTPARHGTRLVGTDERKSTPLTEATALSTATGNREPGAVARRCGQWTNCDPHTLLPCDLKVQWERLRLSC